MAIDLTLLWDFNNPEISEQRFRVALQTAVGDDALILQTQIARTYGLRKEFGKARDLLSSIEADTQNAGAEARVRFALELGRTYASATHSPESLTVDAKERARVAYNSALDVARTEHLDGLAVDAIHMLAFVDTTAPEQLKWAQQALAIVDASTQPPQNVGKRPFATTSATRCIISADMTKRLSSSSGRSPSESAERTRWRLERLIGWSHGRCVH